MAVVGVVGTTEFFVGFLFFFLIWSHGFHCGIARG